MFRYVLSAFLVLTALAISFSAARAGAPENLLGRTLYLTYCAECHGPYGDGKGKIKKNFIRPPTNFRADGYLAKTPDSKIVNILKQGLNYRLKLNKQMPHFAGEIYDETVSDLIDYLRSIPDVQWGKVEAGKKPFMEYCAACHGETGVGDGPKPSGKYDQPADLSRLKKRKLRTNFKTFRKEFVTGSHGEKMADFFPKPEELVMLFNYLGTFHPGRPSYNYSCAMCHGERGDGVTGLYKDKSLKPKSIVERNYLDNTTDEEFRRIVLNGAEYVKNLGQGVAHFDRPLTDREIRAIIKYMRVNF